MQPFFRTKEKCTEQYKLDYTATRILAFRQNVKSYSNKQLTVIYSLSEGRSYLQIQVFNSKQFK